MLEVRFVGSNSIGERLVPDLVDAYFGLREYRPRGWAPGRQPEERMQEARGAGGAALRAYVDSSGASNAFVALGERRADFGIASRVPTAAEIAQVQRAINVDIAAPAHLHVLAVGGVGIIAHPANPVRRLTLDQAHGIFTGAITNWSQVGGADRTILVYGFGMQNSAVNEMFSTRILRGRPITRISELMRSQPEIATAVASEPGGIGYVGLAFAGSARALSIVSSCGLEFEPGEFAIRTEDYPLEQRYYMFSAEAGRNGLADEFLRWATSPASYDVVRDAGYTSLQPMIGSQDYTRFRLADTARAAPLAPDARYTEAMSAYSLAVRNSLRLSTTFRFERGVNDLDLRGLTDIARIAEFLSQPDNRRYRVNVLGFSDNAGAFGQNRAQSDRLATLLAQRLRDRGITVGTARGFGHIAPIACDDDPEAPYKNRRVEIWLTPG